MFEEEFKIMILHLVQQFEESIPTYYYIVKTAGLIFITLFVLVLSFDVYCIYKKNAVIKMPNVVSVSMGIILFLGYFGLTYELPSLPIYYGWHAAGLEAFLWNLQTAYAKFDKNLFGIVGGL